MIVMMIMKFSEFIMNSHCVCTVVFCLEMYIVYAAIVDNKPFCFVCLSYMVRTDRRSPTGFLVRCSAQTSPLFVVEYGRQMAA